MAMLQRVKGSSINILIQSSKIQTFTIVSITISTTTVMDSSTIIGVNQMIIIITGNLVVTTSNKDMTSTTHNTMTIKDIMTYQRREMSGKLPRVPKVYQHLVESCKAFNIFKVNQYTQSIMIVIQSRV